MTFTDYIANSEANYRIERRLADAERNRLIRRLRRGRKAAAKAKSSRVPQQRARQDHERQHEQPVQQAPTTKAEYPRVA